MNMRTWSLLLLLFLSSAISAQHADHYLDTPLPQAWEEGGEVFRQTLPVDDQWWKSFGDTTLDSLISIAVDRNYSVLTAIDRMNMAKAGLRMERSGFFPTVGINAGWTRQQTSGNTSELPQSTQHYYDVSANMSWELDIFGRLRNAKQQAKALYAQSKDYQQAVRTQLIAGIANVYYTLLMLDEQLAISQQTEESWKETVASTRALMDAGLANEAATSQMEAAYYSVQTSILDLKEQINQVENSLALLLAETPRRYERGKLADQQLPEDVAVGVPMQMLSNRPDVRAAERSLEQAFYVTNQARAAFYPSIVLSGSAGWTNSAGSMIVNPGKFLASAVGSLTQPLFNKGQIMAQYRIAKAQQEEASLSFQQALLNAGSEVNDALVACQTSKAKTVLFEKQIQSLEKALESTSLLMEHGTTTYLEVLTARQSLLSAQLSQTANRFTEIQSVINLYQALGGGRE